MRNHIRKHDLVQVIRGNDAGASPRRVVQVLDGGRKLQVEGINQVKRHVRRGHPKSPQGGRLQLDMPIDSSNVLFYCGNCGHGVRLGIKYVEGEKLRVCKKCGESRGAIGETKSEATSRPVDSPDPD